MISFRTLGAVSLRNEEGQDLHSVLAQPKRLALLGYLALARPHGPHRRDSLLALFWPELDGDSARNALTQAVHFLRRALGETLQGRHGDVLQVDRTRLWCDAVAFETAIQDGRLDEAIQLYAGPLLDGLHVMGAPEFDRWLDAERARLDSLHAHALEALAEQRERQGDVARAVELWQRCAARDPYDSRVALRLMQAMAAAGNPAGAIRHARLHETLLRGELDVAPDPRIPRFIESLHTVASVSAPGPARAETTDAGSNEPAALSAGTAAAAAPVGAPTLRELAPAPAAPATGAPPAPQALPGMRTRSSQAARRTRRVLLAGAVLAAALLPGVVTALRGAPWIPEDERLAMQAYERGRQQELSRSRLGLESAEAYYRDAIARKPDFALGYAGLAAVHGFRADYGFGPAGPSLDSARRMAQYAYRLDSTLSTTRAALAVSLGDAGHFAAAEAEFQRALAIDSLDARAHYWYSVLLVALGRGHEAMKHVQIAQQLDPLGPRGQVAMQRYARFLIDSTRPHLALPVRERRKILKFQPGEPWARAQEAIELAEVGECPAAYVELAQAAQLASPDNIRLLPAVGTVRWHCNDRPGARAVLQQMKERPDARDHGYRIALLSIAMGEKDSALVWLNHQRWTVAELSGVSAGHPLDPLRSDPRFHELMRRIGVR